MFREFIKRIRSPSVLKVHNYWKSPESNPKGYLIGAEKSLFLLNVIKGLGMRNPSILEIGCSVGRNLNCLYSNGFTNLVGIEINSEAVKLMRQEYPKMFESSRIINADIENVIRTFEYNEFDIIFTMAVFQHISIESEWIFSRVAFVTKYLITIEGEGRSRSWAVFSRKYDKVFERYGMKQLKVVSCCDVKGLESYTMRVFEKIEFKKVD
jgi:SAM-dependent methyltransferase